MSIFRMLARLRRIAPRSIETGLAIVLLALVASPAAQTERLELVSTPWSPFTNSPGEARFALDLVDAALERIGITANTTIVPESRLTPSLLDGEFDGSAALWRDPERERVLIYSRPYLENRLILVGREGSDVSAATLSDLEGRPIALVEGYAYGEAVEDSTGPIYVPSRSEEDSLSMLLDGEVDYTLMDEIVVQFILKNYPEEARTRLEIGRTPLIVRTLHFALRRDLPDAASIVGRFNSELSRMMTDRSYHRLLQLDWIYADIDGDGRAEYVPLDDQVGPDPPESGYTLFSITPPAPEPVTTRRFYLGGSTYEGWSGVPDRFKVPRPGGTFSDGASFTIFSFTW